ncbi:hypothetical protein RM844_31760 [Streptomyces sp. DSM 44915]|uniref:Secreted protein n=1 Tax=Streptomyces chisholmiae TaxID=3075540 RepID=A0ABU2K0R8_9ACTN|nr:hypothetical protein [Streptomyces sp. DSM 44915]MDT0270855.1 hypothetical protein [Streptomyces sp. DSM 44915]
MSGWFAAVWPVITFVLGGLLAFGRDYFTESRQDRREREARQHERDTAARERREEFELEHLIEVHRLLLRLWATVEEAERASESFRALMTAAEREGLPSHTEALANLRSQEQAVEAQLGFILVDQVRELATTAYREAWSIGGQLLDGKASSDWTVARHAFSRAHEALTSRVREIYAGRAERGL